MPDGWEGSSAYLVGLDGANQVLEVTSVDPDANYLFGGDYGWGDVVVTARVSLLDASGDYYGMFTRAQSGTDFYANYFGTSTSTAALQVWDMTIASPTAHGATTAQQRSAAVSPSFGAAYRTLRVAAVGLVLHYSYDSGADLHTYTVNGAYPTGRIGLCVGYSGGHAYWDDIIVRSYVSPEPSAAAGTMESIACP
jgi:hypothetical protein